MRVLHLLTILQVVFTFTEANRYLAQNINSFSITFFKKIVNGEDGNLICSPFSIYTAFAMVGTGARGQTMYELESVFNWRNFEVLQQAMKPMYDAITSNDGGDTMLNVTSNMWFDDNVTMLTSYEQKLQDSFSVTPHRESFHVDPYEARLKINRWVEEKTDGQIKDLFSARTITYQTMLVFVNVLLFHGEWEQKFDPKATEKRDFHVDRTKTIKADFMVSTDDYTMYTDRRRGVELLALPYSGRKFSMIFVKSTGSDIDTIASRLTVGTINQWMSALKRKDLVKKQRIYIPKFEFDYSPPGLIDLFKNMGVNALFNSNGANLSGMTSNKNVYVSSIAHKAYVKVDETGVYAAAATGIGASKNLQPPPTFSLDSPFLFFIVDTTYNSIIFCGKLAAPNEAIPTKDAKKAKPGKYMNTGVALSSTMVILLWSLAMIAWLI